MIFFSGNLESVCKAIKKLRQLNIEMQVLECQIKGSKYNRRYRNIMCDGLPNYLAKYQRF